MTDSAKLEHIIYLVRKFEEELSRSQKAYEIAMKAYSANLINGIPAKCPSQPISFEDNASDYLARIKAILEEGK